MEALMQTKVTLPILILLLVFTSYYLSQLENKTSNGKAADKHEVSATKAIQPRNTQTNPISPPNKNTSSQSDVPEMAVKNWLHSRGYVDMEVINGKLQEIPTDYNSYSEPTLKSLADSDDPIAQMYYSDRQLTKQNYLDAEKYARAALINGLSKPIKNLVSVEIHKLGVARSNSSSAEAKEHYKKAMAWFEVASIRNDKFMTQMKQSYEVYSKDLELTPADQAQIKKLAEEMYKSLEDERINKGLGSFDNSLPGAK